MLCWPTASFLHRLQHSTQTNRCVVLSVCVRVSLSLCITPSFLFLPPSSPSACGCVHSQGQLYHVHSSVCWPLSRLSSCSGEVYDGTAAPHTQTYNHLAQARSNARKCQHTHTHTHSSIYTYTNTSTYAWTHICTWPNTHSHNQIHIDMVTYLAALDFTIQTVSFSQGPDEDTNEAPNGNRRIKPLNQQTCVCVCARMYDKLS